MRFVTYTIVVIITVFALTACTGNGASPAFEYKAMSLYEMFDYDKERQEKISSMLVSVDGHFTRTDMDVWDYTDALNHHASQGWELVTVNKSNYWVFKRRR